MSVWDGDKRPSGSGSDGSASEIVEMPCAQRGTGGAPFALDGFMAKRVLRNCTAGVLSPVFTAQVASMGVVASGEVTSSLVPLPFLATRLIRRVYANGGRPGSAHAES
jgi:hypothetical protein